MVIRTRSRTFLLILLSSAILGYSLVFATEVFGLSAAATKFTDSYEQSGGEKVSQLGVRGYANGWNNCNGVNCLATPNNVRVSWTINDGTSSFVGIWGRTDGGGGLYCPEGHNSATVNASPSNPTGTVYVYNISGPCTAGYGAYWSWGAGMCDTANDCLNVYLATRGPHIGWVFIAPGSPAQYFTYYWY